MPMEILRFQYSFLIFDAEGKIDRDFEEEAQLASDILTPVLSSFEKSPDNVIEARHRFAKKRYEHKYTWKPSTEIEAAIINEIFGNE